MDCASFAEEINVFIHKRHSEEAQIAESELALLIEQSSFPSSFFQPIVRGLPRQYLQTDPSISKIKKPFQSRSTLLRHLIDRPLLSLYSEKTLPQNAHVILFTWVISDGWGDLFAQFEAAQLLARHFPQLKITLITLVHKDTTPPQFDHPFTQHHLAYCGKINETVIHEAFSQEHLEEIESADLILEIPTAFPYMDALLKCLGKNGPLHERIGEHSLIDTVHYHPGTRARCMGLHFLEKGTFVKKAPAFSWNDISMLKTKRLLHLLIGSASIETYRQTHRFQFAYTKTLRGLYLYLSALLSSLKDDDRDVDICFYQIRLLAHVLKEKFEDGAFSHWNIKEICIYFQQFQTIIPIAPQGKRVRLIHCESLPHEDVLMLTALTDDLIGATGDQSVLEAIATGKPFFFDPPAFKRPFLKDLSLIAEQKLYAFPCLSRFFRLCLKNPSLPLEENQHGYVNEEYLHILDARLSLDEDTDEKIGTALGECLKDPALPTAFAALSLHLAENYAIDPVLCGLVARALLHRRNPSLAIQEEENLSLFINGEQSLDETLIKIQMLLNQE